MQTNVYRALLELLPQDPLLVGTVTEINADGTATVELPGGGTLRARGVAEVGDRVFVRGGVIDSTAPALTVLAIEI